MKRGFAIIFGLAFFAFACDPDAGQIRIVDEHSLTGTWLYTEYGYSPGGGYFTEPVAATPPQTLGFEEGFRLTTNIQGLTKYKFYKVLDDPSGGNPVIAFYENYPGELPQDISKLQHSYSMEQSAKNLTLRYRWCIEGCHLGFKKISQTVDH